ncbi:MAG TPA: 4Fe-4S binding protein, partial [Thermodesulfobacteriota bacterium]|nr:4Fe-4S binding protein [Thermodesulfobacteriota bacterium]
LEESKAGSSIFGIEPDPGATHMKGQIGYIEMIGLGTLAIAHAELLDAHQQSVLANYLRQGWFHRVYGQETVRSKTRIVFMATGTEAEVMEKFIPELREELANQKIVLPPLTQRLKDIPILADYYLRTLAKKNAKKINGLSREATEKLVSYTWPGNVKELENVIQRAAIVSSEDVIIPGDLIFVIPSEKETHKINLLRQDRLRDLLRHPMIPAIFMWFNIFMVAVMAGFTLYGGSRPEGHPLQEFGNNPGMLITWLVWFPILPISAFLIGRIWCGMCPIAGIGDLVSRIFKLNLPVPKFLKRMDFWMVVVSFIFLDYIEELLGVADKPWATGMLLVVIISISVLFCVLFERKTFCRYVCPLAGMLGTYSTMSMVEVRGNKKICQTQCGQHSCYKGTPEAPGCPMFSYPASLTSNSECMMCLNCLKSCENRGTQLNIRPPLQELWRQSQPLLSVSFLGVMLVGLMARHQFPKLTYWQATSETLGLSEAMLHTGVYFFFVAIAVIPFILGSTLSAAASQEKVSENMAHYGMAFIPLALAGHLAHVSHEFLSNGIYEFVHYMIKLYDSIVYKVPIGTREVVTTHFVNSAVITFLKFMIIFGGLFASIIALVMIARRLSEKNIFARILPHLIILVFFWIGYLFIFTGSTDPPNKAAAAPKPAVPGIQAPAAPGKPMAPAPVAPGTAAPARPGTGIQGPGVPGNPM